MSYEHRLGNLNGHAVGRLMKETVRRAIVIIRAERATFESQLKIGYSGAMDDILTSADKKAQEVYLRAIRECFPGYGIIAEEDGVHEKSMNGLYFTVDPLDGTKAFVRRQSHGVGTMIALVDEESGEVVSAYIGDINTQEIYGYRPGSDRVHRITEFDTAEELQGKSSQPLSARYALLRDPPERLYTPISRKSLKAFKNYEVEGGSIGIWAARLWKGETAALLIPRGNETPWDSTPVYGISKKLGFVCMRPIPPPPNEAAVNAEGALDWELYDPEIPTQVVRRHHDLLIIHKSYLKELGADINIANLPAASAAA